MSTVLLLTEASVFWNMVCIRYYLSDELFVSGIVWNLSLLYNFLWCRLQHTLFLCAKCTNDFRCTLTHVSTRFVFLSPSNFLSPGILPSSLDGKKFMSSSKLLLFFGPCVCVLPCVIYLFCFLCSLKA